MKKFVNKETAIPNNEKEDVKVGYADLALIGLNASPKEGWTTDEMRKRIKVIDKLEKVAIGKTIDLEDAEFVVLLNSSKINWRILHKDIVKFDDYLQELSKK